MSVYAIMVVAALKLIALTHLVASTVFVKKAMKVMDLTVEVGRILFYDLHNKLNFYKLYSLLVVQLLFFFLILCQVFVSPFLTISGC